jgi:ribonuclease E
MDRPSSGFGPTEEESQAADDRSLADESQSGSDAALDAAEDACDFRPRGDEPSDSETPSGERRPGRRRRRRRRGPRDSAATPQDALDDRSPAESGEEAVADADEELAAEPDTSGDELESRPRRPRRRRGSGRHRERTERVERTEEAPAESDHGDLLADEAEDFEEPEYLGEESSLDEEGGEGEPGEDEDSPRVGFRNIPTWQETVGYVIATNMESRAKNPGSGRSYGRRGRGGGNRGGGRRRPPDRQN